MRAGTLLRAFKARDGTDVRLRAPRWEDLDDLLEFINGLVEEDAMIAVSQKHTRESETDWLARKLTNMEKDKHVAVVAEADGGVVGSCELNPRPGRMSHVGSLGISVKENYRDRGIGQELMRELETRAVKAGIEVLCLEVYSISPAVEFYRRLGYVEYGRLPGGIRYKGEYVDAVSMYKLVGR